MKASVTLDEYEAWLEHPVTQWVMEAFEAQAGKQRRGWEEASWIAGECDPLMLNELRTRADTYKAMREAGYSDILNALEQDEVADSQ